MQLLRGHESLTVPLSAGIASEDTLNLVRENGFSYIVVSRSKPEQMEDGSFEQIKEGIRAKEMRIGDGAYLHCISDDKMPWSRRLSISARVLI